MDQNVSPLERAFELAATGRYTSVSEVKLQMSREGYSLHQLEGPLLRKQIVDIILKARNA